METIKIPSFERLHWFYVLSKTLSFTQTSTKLGIPKSSLSKAIKQLEEEMNVQLFNRSTRKMNLTDKGRELLERIQVPIEALEHACLNSPTTSKALSGHLRLTSVALIGREILSPLIVEFARKHPRIHIEILHSDRMIDLVSEGVDIAFRTGPIENQFLICKKWMSIPRILCASPLYEKERGLPRDPTDLKNHSCLAISPEHTKWELIHKDGRKAKVQIPWVFCSSPIETLKEPLLKGMGITWLPEFYVAKELRSKKLIPVLSDWKMTDAPLYAVYHPAKQISPNVRALLNELEPKLSNT